MARLISICAFLSGLIALTSAAYDLSQAEWTGKPWMGTWESDHENWQALFDALGIVTQYEGVHHAKAILSLFKAGDHYHHVFKIPDKNFKNHMEFKLGEEFTQSDHETVFKITFTEVGNKLICDVKTPTKNKEVEDTYEVIGDQLLHEYKHGNVTERAWYKKVANPTPAPL